MKLFYLAICLTLGFNSIAQTAKKPEKKGWHLLDAKKDGYNGVSATQAYDFLKSKNKKGKKVIVAVLDSGIDTTHEDLKPILWTNSKEIPGNGIDDDKNGYIDDMHGWNFLGGPNGKSVKEDSYEYARFYHANKSRFESMGDGSSVRMTKELKAEFDTWLRAKAKLFPKEEGGMDINVLKKFAAGLTKSDSILKIAMKKDVYTGVELKAFEATAEDVKKAKTSLYGIMKGNGQEEATNVEFIEGMNTYIKGEVSKEDAKTTAPKDNRFEVTGDDETVLEKIGYGNNELTSATPFHGTHCAGIIAAIRNNNKGMDGMADNVEIMTIRAVPDGDEHDKDIANGIRYAVDNGARVISMSFGKDFSPQKEWVDAAFKYAESKGVLLVHAAGNDAKNIDTEPNYPNNIYKDGLGRCESVITVGASSDLAYGTDLATFSNYGKDQVDVFSPGVAIYSTIPGGNTYGNAQGTSMACPLVAGMAAQIMSYYPELTAKDVKAIIEKSTIAPKYKVNKPGTDEKVDLSELCKTGGFVNAFEAIKMADTYKSISVPKNPKSSGYDIKPTPTKKKIIKKKRK